MTATTPTDNRSPCTKNCGLARDAQASCTTPTPLSELEVLTGARATVRLGAVRRNYQTIVNQLDQTDIGVAIKANAYGLGAAPIAQTLWAAGCREFFVAQIDEGISVRNVLPDATIHVLNGLMPGTEPEMFKHNLIPLILDLGQLELWRRHARTRGKVLPAGIHIDTGMHRTGLPAKELKLLISEQNRLAGLDIKQVVSHLASADDLNNLQADRQLETFRSVIHHFPKARASLANSAGIFRDKKFHLDLVRPGIAVYGGAPLAKQTNPLEPVVILEAPILQITDVRAGDPIGYGGSYTATKPGRHAIVGAGYADGLLRSLSNTGQVAVGDYRCNIVGRISMDMTTIDVSDVPANLVYRGAPVELIGTSILLDDIASDAGTISYELLVGIGQRYNRIYNED